MKFGRLQLTNFTVFEDATFDFCPGINVLIGANGTGKSHVLKAAYAVQNCFDGVSSSLKKTLSPPSEQDLDSLLFPALVTHLSEVFHVDFKRLIREDNADSSPAPEGHLISQDGITTFGVSMASGASFEIKFPDFDWDEAPCVFIPSREFLAAYEGFIAAFTKRESAFDRTYFDLCVHLSASPLRGKAADWGKRISEKLENELPGRVELKDGKFFVGVHPAHVVAEGHRKLAIVTQLLRNGGITANSTIYWDEPESGLNPKLVKVIADILMMLAESGVQIVIATHDYLLTQELSLAVEYRTIKAPVRFFSLTADHPALPVTVQIGDMLADLDRNPIQEEFTALYDREQSLFYSTKPATAAKGES